MTDARRARSTNRTVQAGRTDLGVLRGMTSAENADSLSAQMGGTLSNRLSSILDLLSEEERERLISRTVAFLVARRGPAAALPFDE